MVPNAAGGSGIGSRPVASASDAAGDPERAAVAPSASARTDTGSRASCATSARWPSTAR